MLLVSLYSVSFLRNSGLVTFFSAVLVFVYGFIFVIIQLEDYSVLLGSIGLFIVLALIMYFSRNIKWYKHDEQAAVEA